MATASQFRSQIREHMNVVGPDGQAIGTVDRIEGERIKLTKNSPGSGGEHRFLDLSDVAQVRGDEVHMAHGAKNADGAQSGQGAHGDRGSPGANRGQAKDRSM
jgi:hypothetical protein